MTTVYFSLSYVGGTADDHIIELYDVGQAIVGFQRSLALTTHAILNDEVIVQAPALKGAQIFALPAERGSWKLTAAITIGLGAIYHLGTAPKDAPLGNLIGSAYDCVISETLGFHVDYSKSLGQQYEELRAKKTEIKKVEQSRLDSVIEKTQISIRNIHRPIINSKTALSATITTGRGAAERPIGKVLDKETYDYIIFQERTDFPSLYIGKVSSYNINTFKGRVYVLTEGRAIPFEMANEIRNIKNIALITKSLTVNAADRESPEGTIRFEAYLYKSRAGQIKSFLITALK